MKIQSIALKVPTKKLTNQVILDLIAHHSNGVSKAKLKTYQRIVEKLFQINGSEVRYIRDTEKNEKASRFVTEAMKDVLDKASIKKDEIDLLIYCGVGKGFLEPANAYFFANAMGMECSCFDISDACMSWVRALEISYQFLKSGGYRTIMIINGEFNAEHAFPMNFKVKNLGQMEYTFPTYTVGEAATATIVSASDDEWSFHYKTQPELSDLCNIPLEGYESFIEPNNRIGRNGVNYFVAYGKEMFDSTEVHLTELVKEHIEDLEAPDIYFPHAASNMRYLDAAKKIAGNGNIEKLYTKVFPNYGNLVSASIPAGMFLALEEGRLKRGDRVVFIPASAGMVYGVVQFNY